MGEWRRLIAGRVRIVAVPLRGMTVAIASEERDEAQFRLYARATHDACSPIYLTALFLSDSQYPQSLYGEFGEAK